MTLPAHEHGAGMSLIDPAPAGRRPAGLSRSASLGVLLITLAAVFWQDLGDVVEPWFEPSSFYSHGFLALAMTVFLLWRDRHRFLHLPDGRSALCGAGAAMAAGLWFVGWAADLQAVRVAATLAVFVFGSCAVLGTRSLFSFGMPFALLMLATPMWGPLIPSLQNLSTLAVHQLVAVSGIPVHVDGNFIALPTGVLEVEGGCSGLGYVLVALTLATYLLLQSRTTWKSAILVLCTALLAGLGTNWLRIYIIAQVAYQAGMGHRLVHDHEWLGWVVFVVIAIPLLLWANARLPARINEPAADPVPRGARVPAAWVAAMLALVSVAPLGASVLDALPGSREPGFVSLQPEEAGFRRVAAAASPWQPEYPSADVASRYVYRDPDGRELYAFEAAYRTQSDGRELINIMNDINGIGWSSKKRSEVTLEIGTLTVPIAQRVLERSGGSFLCLWYWYDLGGEVEASDTAAKLVQIRRRLAGRTDAAVIAAAIPMNEADCAQHESALAAFHRSVLSRALRAD